MTYRDRATLSKNLFSFSFIVRAVLIVAIVLLAGRTQRHYNALRRSMVWGCPVDLCKIRTELGQSCWCFRESVMVNRPSPNEHMFPPGSDFLSIGDGETNLRENYRAFWTNYKIDGLRLGKFRKVFNISRSIRTYREIYLSGSILGWKTTAIGHSISNRVASHGFTVLRHDLAPIWPIAAQGGSLRGYIVFIGFVADLPQEIAEYAHGNSSYGRPSPRFTLKEYAINGVHWFLIVLIFILDLTLGVAGIGIFIHFGQTGRYLFLYQSLVCIVTWAGLCQCLWLLVK